MLKKIVIVLCGSLCSVFTKLTFKDLEETEYKREVELLHLKANQVQWHSLYFAIIT